MFNTRCLANKLHRPNQQQQPPPPSWASSSSSPTPGQDPTSYPSFYAPEHSPATTAPNSAAPLDRHSTSQAYAPYYTVGSDEEDGWTPVRNKDRASQGRQSLDGGAREVKGYDVGEHHGP